MVVFPNCKINLGLSVLRKRPDNFHDLETIFYPLPFYDALEIVRKQENQIRDVPELKLPEGIMFRQTGIQLGIEPDDNICIGAWKLLKNDFPDLPGINIHLHKNIPVGAGLGGGSADAVFLLTAINNKFRLNLDDQQLHRYALKLGSDCPFFLVNKPCLATGRGEKLSVVDLDLSVYTIVIVNPGIHVNTGMAFSKIIPRLPVKSIADIVRLPIPEWKHQLVNDFEAPVFEMHPGIAALKEKLYTSGALYSAMSGSGSTVFGIFARGTAGNLSFPPDYIVRSF
ncbi:MAG: 4-(cytidine 5'-diphospho)-2-C-methyl-D-erythritol kinase [Chitinophagaceae bacterium]